tara:strand:+ start:46516 stop:46656 length:141 start_codon:yes stop_codon:yes gene_type:complete
MAVGIDAVVAGAVDAGAADGVAGPGSEQAVSRPETEANSAYRKKRE